MMPAPSRCAALPIPMEVHVQLGLSHVTYCIPAHCTESAGQCFSLSLCSLDDALPFQLPVDQRSPSWECDTYTCRSTLRSSPHASCSWACRMQSWCTMARYDLELQLCQMGSPPLPYAFIFTAVLPRTVNTLKEYAEKCAPSLWWRSARSCQGYILC